ncbi:MAG: hypothetical protein RIF32_17905 [Leptospirales bacterium]
MLGLSGFACTGNGYFAQRVGLAEPECAAYDFRCNDFAALSLGALLLSAEQLTVPGAFLWLNGTNGFSDNQGAVVWRDSSGNGFDFAGSGVGISQEFLNGRPLISAQGEGTLIRNVDASTSGFASDTVTIYVLQRQSGTKTDTTLFNWTIPPDRINVHLSFGDVLYFDYGDTLAGGRISVGQPAGWDDVFHLVELHRDGTAGEITVDGATVLAATFSDALTLSGTNTFFLLAKKIEEHRFSGEIAEIIVYSRALTNNERGAVRCGLGVKYALAITGC